MLMVMIRTMKLLKVGIRYSTLINVEKPEEKRQR